MSKNLSKLIAAIDIYGWPISMNYHGNEVYRTYMGACCSFITFVLIMSNFLALTVSYLDGSQ